MLTALELDQVEAKCRTIVLTTSEYVATDFVMALFDTVLDYQNHVETIRKAGEFFAAKRRDTIRTLDDLEHAMERFPGDREGNTALALYLWNNRHWRRAHELRGLVRFFRERDVTNLESLREWAAASKPEDFIGHIRGLGPAVYRWLVMRLGVETIKPDVHVLRFVGAAVGRRISEEEAVEALEVAAQRMGIGARILDWSVWEWQRGSDAVGSTGGGSVTSTVDPSPQS